ncbi:zinc-binding dehydrogenase, putative [Plasmodium ovale]|uniref:Zinc-binding dehydrogenase, putative n=1 Tax=Plasmodium ovale TaxID=36330 RepID=A0A1D3KXP7_PLAOA|nr:zinc-binding dehydrogenase, putative [Plasmodium ovale]
MKSILLKGINQLVFSNHLKRPELKRNDDHTDENDLLIKVYAVGINKFEILIKKNVYAHFIKGICMVIEISRIVEEYNCKKLKKGYRVIFTFEVNVIKINKIIAVATSNMKDEKALEFGATNYVFHNEENFTANVLKFTKKINLTFDCFGKSMFEKNNYYLY